jgi:hypothetical protein
VQRPAVTPAAIGPDESIDAIAPATDSIRYCHGNATTAVIRYI